MNYELFRTPVHIPIGGLGSFQILPNHRLLFVGSCFATTIGQHFADNQFQTTVNPYGVMYNPASVLHTIQRFLSEQPAPDVAVLTLGTNHVYILKSTGNIVDNCEKRPQRLFREETLTVEQCTDMLRQCVALLHQSNPDMHIILTVSPIRYAKYGFHRSQLSKATLLLAVDNLLNAQSPNPPDDKTHSSLISYFPAYEIVLDELRDYRFYAADMLHPTQQAADYIYERFSQAYFAPETHRFVAEWQPIRQALAHKPFHPESTEYQQFHEQTLQKMARFRQRYGLPDE